MERQDIKKVKKEERWMKSGKERLKEKKDRIYRRLRIRKMDNGECEVKA